MQSMYDFSQALKFLKDGKKLQRWGWNGKDLFIQLQVPDENSKMNRPYAYITAPAMDNGDTGKGEQRVPWICSQTDLLADDWMIVE